MNLLAIDPGSTHSAFVLFDGTSVLASGIFENADLLHYVRKGELVNQPFQAIAIERIRAQGKKMVGNETFETAEWSGMYFAASPHPSHWITRIEAFKVITKNFHEPSPKTADARVRAALIQQFGKLALVADEWAALAVAETWWRKNTEARA